MFTPLEDSVIPANSNLSNGVKFDLRLITILYFVRAIYDQNGALRQITNNI